LNAFVRRTLTDSIAQTPGEVGEDERILPMFKKMSFSFLHRAATVWSGLATALYSSANILLLSFARINIC
jgi:hypothetical protein